MPPPRFSADLNWGHLLTIGTLVCGGFLAWGAHTEAMTAMRSTTAELKAATQAHEQDIRLLTLSVGRQDERISNHVEFWKRLETKLDAMESRLHGIATQLGKQANNE